MDYLKRTLADTKAELELTFKLVSITLTPPPSAPVFVFLRFVRDLKIVYTSQKYKLEPSSQPGRSKLFFRDTDFWTTVNKYYANKTKQWEAKEVLV